MDQTTEDVKSLPSCRLTDTLRDETVTEISGDRRGRRRYALALEVVYKIVKNGRVYEVGSGKSLDLSGSGIAFETHGVVPPGSSIELSIAWPVLLGETCPLQLVITGRVVRSGRSGTAVRMQRYEFRTKGQLRSFTAAAPYFV